jgi:hypothetical protein
MGCFLLVPGSEEMADFNVALPARPGGRNRNGTESRKNYAISNRGASPFIPETRNPSPAAAEEGRSVQIRVLTAPLLPF